MKISDEMLAERFGKDSELLSYAITGYTCREEYLRDQRLMQEYSNAAKPQDVFLLAMAAKVERTDPEILKE